MNDKLKYQDEKWLREKRGRECLEFKEIAEFCDGEWWNVRYWCYKYGIEKGELSYKSYDWMYEQYWRNKLSDQKVASKLGMWRQTIRKWRHKLGIPTRDHGEAIHLAQGNHVNITKKLLEIIDGSLLGDGSISSYSEYSGFYTIGQKFRSYCKYRSNQLDKLGIEQAGKIGETKRESRDINKRLNGGHIGKSKTLTLYLYASRRYHQLREQRERWYPDVEKGADKRVPKDVIFSPLSLLLWFLEDGYYRDRPEHYSQQLHFSTNCFPKTDVDFLNNKLSTLLNVNSFQTKQNKYGAWILECWDKTTITSFFNYLSPLPNCLKADYGYKFPSSYL